MFFFFFKDYLKCTPKRRSVRHECVRGRQTVVRNALLLRNERTRQVRQRRCSGCRRCPLRIRRGRDLEDFSAVSARRRPARRAPTLTSSKNLLETIACNALVAEKLDPLVLRSCVSSKSQVPVEQRKKSQKFRWLLDAPCARTQRQTAGQTSSRNKIKHATHQIKLSIVVLVSSQENVAEKAFSRLS